MKNTADDAGHEEEVFQPKICGRSSEAMSQRGGNVYSRLSESARELTERKHNEHKKMLET